VSLCVFRAPLFNINNKNFVRHVVAISTLSWFAVLTLLGRGQQKTLIHQKSNITDDENSYFIMVSNGFEAPLGTFFIFIFKINK
jgi:hypothetical protein